VLTALGILVIALVVVWLAAVWLALRTPALRNALNAHPEELLIEWRSAWSWWPGRVRLVGVRVRGQDEQDQWYGEADHADLIVGLGPLFRREIDGRRVRLHGVSFRLRPRLDHPAGRAFNPEHLAPIPGLENPPTNPPPAAPPDVGPPAAGPHWKLRLAPIEVTELREVWVEDWSLRCGAGSGVTGRLDYELGGAFRVELERLLLASAVYRRRGADAATNLEVTLQGVLGPLRFHDTHGAAYFGHLSARAELRGDILGTELLARHLGETDDLGFEGVGRVSGTVNIEAGRIAAGSRLGFQSTGLELRLSRVSIRGRAELEVVADVPPGTNAPRSLLQLRLTSLGLRHRADAAAADDLGAVELRAVAHDPVLPGGFRDVEVDLKLGPLRLPDAQVLNGFLPASFTATRLRRGAFQVEGLYRRERSGVGTGRVSLDGEDLGFQLGPRECAGRIAVRADFGTGRDRQLRVPSASVALSNVMISGVASRRSDGWFGRVDIDRGAIELGDSTNIVAGVGLDLLDTRPIVALLGDDEESPGWMGLVPNLKNLKGGVRVKVDAEGTTFRDLHLRGSATEMLGQLQVGTGGTEGLLYARYGILSALFDLRPGQRDWTIFGAKRKYRARLAELKLESLDLPEGEDAEGDGEGR